MSAAEQIRIVDFTDELAEELVLMWRESFEAGVGVVDPHPIEEQRAYLMKEIVPNNTVRVALLDGAIAGFVASNRQSISQLYVRRGFQRRGLGTRLLEGAKERSNGRLSLYTFARNASARAFYESHGFRLVARGFEAEWELEDLKYEWTA
jgi:ribosomal protein S18 acetylase RimI-like enzyme